MPRSSGELNAWDVPLAFPSPLALAYKHYRAVPDIDVPRKAKALFALAEVSCRFLAASMTADYLSLELSAPPPPSLTQRLLGRFQRKQPAKPKAVPPVPAWVERLPIGVGLEFGKWLGALRECGQAIPANRAFMPEAVALVRQADVFRLIEDLLSLRNRFIHPKGGFELSDDEILELMRQAKPKVSLWLRHLQFLTQYPLCVARRSDVFGSSVEEQAPQGPQSYSLVRHMGGQYLEERQHDLALQAPLLDHYPFLVNPAGDALLYLWPFIVTGEPGDLGEPGLLFVFERQMAAHCNSLEYAAVGRRSTFTWTAHAPKSSHEWLRQQRASLPGVIRTKPKSLASLLAPEPDTMIGRQLGGRRSYTVVRRLGRGSMGTVYLATDSGNRPYAIKVLSHGEPQTLRRFQKEIDHMGRLKETQGIVGLLDWGLTGEGEKRPYYVMEWAERGDLVTFIQNHCVPLDETTDANRWDLEPRLQVLEQLAQALAGLHEQSMIHRDVKPGNVLLMSDDSIRLADFGLARALTPDRGAVPMTGAYSLVGTMEYMAPEQLAGQQDLVSPAADVFAFGILTFELLLGRLPRRRLLTEVNQAGQSLNEQKALKAIPPGLRQVVARCTHPQPNQRYADGSQIVAALTESLPKLRQATLVVRTQPPDVAVQIDGETRGQQSTFELPSGPHVVGVADHNWVAEPQVVRLVPLGRLEVVLPLQPSSAVASLRATPRGDEELTPITLIAYLKLVDLALVMKSTGYGTTQTIEDRNSGEIWRLIEQSWGNRPIPLCCDLLHRDDSTLRAKALHILFHYAANKPDSVNLRDVHVVMVREKVGAIAMEWLSFLQSRTDQTWPLLVETLTTPDCGDLASMLPAVLRRMGNRPDVIAALVQALPKVVYAKTRREVVRSLAGRHPAATSSLLDVLAADSDAATREVAAFALADRGPPEVFEALRAALASDPIHAVRVACANAMLRLDVTKAREAFQQFRATGDEAVVAAIDIAERFSKV